MFKRYTWLFLQQGQEIDKDLRRYCVTWYVLVYYEDTFTIVQDCLKKGKVQVVFKEMRLQANF